MGSISVKRLQHFFAWDLAAVRISGCDNTARVDCSKFIGSNVFSTFTVEKKRKRNSVSGYI